MASYQRVDTGEVDEAQYDTPVVVNQKGSNAAKAVGVLTAVLGATAVYTHSAGYADASTASGAASSASSLPSLATADASSLLYKTNASKLHAFGKWTFTSASLEYAEATAEVMWEAFNQYILTRNESNWPNYQLIGATGCDSTQRKWSALRYQTGDNNLHFVHDESDTNPVDGNISVREMHDFMKEIHGDLTEPDQFMDQRYTMAAYEIGPYMKWAKQVAKSRGWPYRLLKTNTDREGAYAWVVQLSNDDGQIFETISAHGPGAEYEDEFTYDSCAFNPTTGLNISKEECDARFGDDFSVSNPIGCIFFEFEDEDYAVSKLGEYIEVGESPKDSSFPITLPWITHVASTDPVTDTDFVTKYFGSTGGLSSITHLEGDALSRAGTSHEECDYMSEWIKLEIVDDSSAPTYLHISHHPSWRTAPLKDDLEFGLGSYQKYMASIRTNMNDNVYDRFMDDHIGLETGPDHFAPITKKLREDGNSLLTRREPIPGEHGVKHFWDAGWEKFSIFFYLPVSMQVFQFTTIDVSMNTLKERGLPEFCDWDFCASYYNWRYERDSRTTIGKLTKASECGFSSEFSTDMDDAYPDDDDE